MSLRVLVADDEAPARKRLRSMLEQLGHEVCAEAGDAVSVEKRIPACAPDVVLLDIQMPGEDGLTLARRLAVEHPKITVILVTAHSEHAVEAFDAAVLDYVLKPVRVERLGRALERASVRRKQTESTNPALHLTIGRREHLVQIDQIDCFCAEQGYVVARSSRIEGFVDARLHELEARYPTLLLRVHRSCLAVKTAIAGMETSADSEHRLLFRDGLEPVPISRRQFPEVRGFLRAPVK